MALNVSDTDEATPDNSALLGQPATDSRSKPADSSGEGVGGISQTKIDPVFPQNVYGAFIWKVIVLECKLRLEAKRKAGQFVRGESASDPCPNGYEVITDVNTAKLAVKSFGYHSSHINVGKWAVTPSGCYYSTKSKSFYFNTNEQGRENRLCRRVYVRANVNSADANDPADEDAEEGQCLREDCIVGINRFMQNPVYIGKNMVGVTLNLFLNLLMQIRLCLWLRDTYIGKLEANPDLLTESYFDDMKVNIFLTIFAMKIFVSMKDIFNELRIISASVFDDDCSTYAMSNLTVVLCILVVIIQECVIFVLVLWIGSYYIIVSPDAESMVLNCLALAFITEMDEMIFAALPSSVELHSEAAFLHEGFDPASKALKILKARVDEVVGPIVLNAVYFLFVSLWPMIFKFYVEMEQDTGGQAAFAFSRFLIGNPRYTVYFIFILMMLGSYWVLAETRHLKCPVKILQGGFIVGALLSFGVLVEGVFFSDWSRSLAVIGLSGSMTWWCLAVWLLLICFLPCITWIAFKFMGEPFLNIRFNQDKQFQVNTESASFLSACLPCSLLLFCIFGLMSISGALSIRRAFNANKAHFGHKSDADLWGEVMAEHHIAKPLGEGAWRIHNRGTCPPGSIPCQLDATLCVQGQEGLQASPLNSAYARWCPLVRSGSNCSALANSSNRTFETVTGSAFCTSKIFTIGNLPAARHACEIIGARLCTPVELMRSRKGGWSAEPCGDGGAWYLSEDGEWQCMSFRNATQLAMCCADETDEWQCSRDLPGHTCQLVSCSAGLGPTHCLSYNVLPVSLPFGLPRGWQLCTCATTHCAHRKVEKGEELWKCVAPNETMLQAAPQIKLLRNKSQCKSPGVWMGRFSSALGCASQVAMKGGEFFSYSDPERDYNMSARLKQASCYLENTTDGCADPDAALDFEADAYDFYQVLKSR